MKTQLLYASRRRSAFTLIELLVVIAIIGILVALLLVAVIGILGKGPDVSNRNDILQLSEAIQRFKTDYKQYPRNSLKLCSNYTSYNLALALDRQSVAFLSAMWPDLAKINPNTGIRFWTGINWANRTGATAPVYGNAANPTIDHLDGDQCVVFLIGGPPMTAGTPGMWGGFATNATWPLDPAAPSKKKYMDFTANRLMFRPAGVLKYLEDDNITLTSYPTSTMFPSWADSYSSSSVQMPFVYFSSTNRTNRASGYDRTPNSIALGITPFFSNNNPWTFQNPDTFQIVSAGRDQQFGPGGAWIQSSAAAYAAAGKDDMTNISDRLMGVP